MQKTQRRCQRSVRHGGYQARVHTQALTYPLAFWMFVLLVSIIMVRGRALWMLLDCVQLPASDLHAPAESPLEATCHQNISKECSREPLLNASLSQGFGTPHTPTSFQDS